MIQRVSTRVPSLKPRPKTRMTSDDDVRHGHIAVHRLADVHAAARDVDRRLAVHGVDLLEGARGAVRGLAGPERVDLPRGELKARP